MSICFSFFCHLMWEVTLICECWTNHIFLRETHLVIVYYSFYILLHLICWYLEDFCMYIHEGFGLWFSCYVYIMSNWFCYQGNAESFTNQVGSVLFSEQNYGELMLFLQMFCRTHQWNHLDLQFCFWKEFNFFIDVRLFQSSVSLVDFGDLWLSKNKYSLSCPSYMHSCL